MNSYSPTARAFMVFVWLSGLAALILAFALPPLPGDTFPLNGVALAVTLAAFAGARKVHLLPSQHGGEKAFLTIGHLISFAAIMAYGTRAGVLVALASALSGSLWPRCIPFHKLLFNIAVLTVTAWLAGQVYLLLNAHSETPFDSDGLRALAAASLVYYLVNVGLVVGIVSLSSRRHPFAVWKESFLWITPSYFAAASCALFGQLLFRSDAKMLLLVLPVLGLLFQFYKAYTEKIEQKQRHIEELQASHDALQTSRDALQASRDSLSDLYLSTVRSLATAIDAKDQNTHAHIHRVQKYALEIAAHLGVSGDELEAVKTGALLHDIGKLGVPDYVLLKPGKLTDDERAKMERHAEIGAEILAPVHFPWPVVAAVRHHHERWDGQGYPDKLAGEAIPLGARILAVADVFDALTTDRPYRAAWSHARTLEYIQSNNGTHFDPRIVAAFTAVMVAEAEQARDAAETDQPAANDETAAPPVTHRIHRTASELWALYEISQTLRSGLEVGAMLEQLALKVATVLPDTVCAFVLRANGSEPSALGPQQPPERLLLPDEGTRSEWRVWCAGSARQLWASGTRLVEADALTTRVARDHHVYRGASREDNLLTLLPDKPADDQTPATSLIVPLVFRGEMLGTLNLYRTEETPFTTDDEQLLLRIAEPVQHSLHHDIAFNRTRSDAVTDSLTGLFNTRFVMQSLEPQLRAANDASGESERRAAPYSVLYLDLDNFKPINDTFGHAQGDNVLCDFARLLQRELRPSDLIIRYGGDEFVIVLFHTPAPQAAQIGERIRQAVGEYRPGLVHPRVGEIRLDVSIGIACCDEDGDDINALIAIADHRMFEDKTAHKIGGVRANPPEVETFSNASGESNVTLDVYGGIVGIGQECLHHEGGMRNHLSLVSTDCAVVISDGAARERTNVTVC